MRLLERVGSWESSVAGGGAAAGRRFSASRHARVAAWARRRGFTLIEMLVVMGIIVLALTLAIPTVRFMTGSRSEQAAQNTVSAFLARTRAEAIGLQQAEGVLFYLDPVANRVVLTQVMATPLDSSDPPYSGAVYLDLVPDRDNLVLPAGVRLQTLTSPVNNPSSDPTNVFPNDRYIGFNTVKDGNGTSSAMAVGGVILFDAAGRLATRYYVLRTEAIAGTAGTQTAMGQLLNLGKTSATYTTADNTICQGLRSAVGFALFDGQAFATAGGTDADATTAEASEETWLDGNATSILINRYNGTLIRAE